ncbi:DUF4861 family protein [Pelagicoccus albus]|uniref:DUF4861 family protein n=1 Tax=Pelagicoccus albus TaxID=415222 RepID=A0A7X1B8D3_9BACT|nr:DUF4861 family protein [Pelagicoccus albus]MBC2607538.1 DUF4861 family protein [Pelagicoccus albus]
MHLQFFKLPTLFALNAAFTMGALSLQAQEKVAHCRFVPERKDDFAFENDKVAFRMYGPALAEGGENSGIDCWLKRVDYPIIDRWYRLEAEGVQSYHEDHGEGYDPYHVGSSFGCGGLAIWKDGELIKSNVYRSYKVISDGPEQVKFELSYLYESEGIEEVKRITLDKGNRLFHAVSHFTKDGEAVEVELAVGLTTHEGKADVYSDAEDGVIAAWETIHESGLGTGVILPREFSATIHETDGEGVDDDLAFFVTSTDEDGMISYYAGYGWERAGEITSFEEWKTYLSQFSEED